MYIIILHVLSTFVKFVTKTEWSLSHQYFSVFRQNDYKRPQFLQRGVFKSVVESLKRTYEWVHIWRGFEFSAAS